MNSVAKTEENNVASFLSVIERAASNPAIDVEKMSKLLDMQERILNKQAEMAFNVAMTELQPLLPVIKQTSEIRHGGKLISTYAKYDEIDSKIRPFYTKCGFSISFNSKKNEDGSTTYSGTLAHKDGHSKTAEMVLPADTSGAKNSIQALGSTTSYAKRYLVGMLLNLVTTGEDDDAQSSNTVSIEQAAEIDNLMREVKADVPAFLKYIGAESVLTIKAKDYKEAIDSLNKKKRAK